VPRRERSLFALALIIQAIAALSLWELQPANMNGQAEFAVFLGIELVSFGMLLSIYRSSRLGDRLNRAPLFFGCIVVMILVYSTFLL